MVFGMFEAQFRTDGTFKIDGKDWEPLQGRWKKDGAQVELSPQETSGGCDASGRYTFHLEGTRLRFEVVADPCASRRMVLDQSTWRPAGEAKSVAVRRQSIRELAVLSRADRLRRCNRTEPSGHVEYQNR